MTSRGSRNDPDIKSMSDEEVVAFLRVDEPLAKARAQFRSWAGRIDHMAGGRNGGPIVQRRMEMQACLDIERTLQGYAKPPKYVNDPHYLMHYEDWFFECMAEAVFADMQSNPNFREAPREELMHRAVSIVLGRDSKRWENDQREQAVRTVYALLTVLRKRGILRHGF